jgi:hypothetical protein
MNEARLEIKLKWLLGPQQPCLPQIGLALHAECWLQLQLDCLAGCDFTAFSHTDCPALEGVGGMQCFAWLSEPCLPDITFRMQWSRHVGQLPCFKHTTAASLPWVLFKNVSHHSYTCSDCASDFNLLKRLVTASSFGSDPKFSKGSKGSCRKSLLLVHALTNTTHGQLCMPHVNLAM